MSTTIDLPTRRTRQSGPGSSTHGLPDGVARLRSPSVVFEQTLTGFGDSQRARHLDPDTIRGRERTVRQLQAFSGAFPWQPVWGAPLYDRWAAALAENVATSTVIAHQQKVGLYLTYLCEPAYGWREVCQELFGTFNERALWDLNRVRHSQEYVGRPNRNRPLTRAEIRSLIGQIDPEIRRLQAVGHKGALSAARDLALLTTTYAWGLRRREAARLDLHDWRRQPRLPEFGDFGGLAVRWGKAMAGQPPRRRTVVSVWPWAVSTVRFYVEHVRPLFYQGRRDDGVMFPTERGSRISERSLNDRFAHWRDKADLAEELGPHCLRHTYVTRLIESGYDAGFVTEQVGHSHAATTAIYTALSSDYKNLQVRQHLEASEAEVLRLAFAQADLEAECDEKLAITLALQGAESRRGA
ncbi:tyrosine-type recombinase/integrase [Streptomyces sp. NPDC057908]|uniref:tyrosine-type recombinase/integrase n=1 Tax=Streptomyces sp. NPDC057908 TaxID=3346276 RepID=UPI0036EDF117